jgi:hypothetical protein
MLATLDVVAAIAVAPVVLSVNVTCVPFGTAGLAVAVSVVVVTPEDALPGVAAVSDRVVAAGVMVSIPRLMVVGVDL